MPLPLSLLDRTRTRTGHPDASSLTRTVDRAVHAETAGYHRFWVAEHHGVPGIGSGVPALMVQAVASATSGIRVGSGGVMLPNHRPFVVAEQFAMLVALHGDRIDLGVGRSLGFTRPVREALGAGREEAQPEVFQADIRALRDFLTGDGPVTIRPAGLTAPPVFVLGTGSGLATAAELGLPVVVGGPALRAGRETFDAYRESFRPSGQGDEPYVVASLDVLVADSAREARELALPEAWAMAVSRRDGAFPPLMPTADVPSQMSEREQRAVDQVLGGSIYGTEDEVMTRLTALVDETGADEVMSTGSTYDTDALLESDRRLAAAWHSA